MFAYFIYVNATLKMNQLLGFSVFEYQKNIHDV